MTRTLSNLGWLFVVIDLVTAATLILQRPSGDAATRGLGQGLGTLLAALGVVAALLLWAGRTPDRTLLAILGFVLAVAPAAVGVVLTTSRHGLGLIYPSMRDRGVEREKNPEYAYPDPTAHEVALAIVASDYAKLDTLLHATPAPDLTGRDERGETLVGLATRAAIADGGMTTNLEGLRLLIAAGARPRPDDLGSEESLLEMVSRVDNEAARLALAMLLDAGLSPNAPMQDGRSVLFNTLLTPAAARILLARGVDREVHDMRGDALDWSPVTYQADLQRWAVALALLEGGVPRDHGSPPGSVMARVIRIGEPQLTDADRANPAFHAFMAAVKNGISSPPKLEH